MQTRVKKWGNSLAVRLPLDYIKSLNLHDGSPVEIRETPGGLLLQTEPILEDLLNTIPDDYSPSGFWEDAEPEGREVW